ncbi:unnamed protein product [Vicia faba]|uniref:RING-type domain-containing protein n=1 Tax=Vicia faba TaxID=3906 RepID=A0AAV0ZRD6_VICFA|nr:unnamed protein product [Vicia faba]
MTHNGAHAVASYEGATLHFRSDPDDSVAIAPLTVPTMWPDLIQKSKDGGIDVIETYVFWNLHEPVRRQVLFFFIVFPLSYCYSSVFYIAVFSSSRSICSSPDRSIRLCRMELRWFPSFVWLFLGFYWVTAGGQSLTRVSPQLYWLCITFLAFDVAIVVICVTVACLIGIAVCCFLPCILAILYAVTDQEGATKEEIDLLPKYKFRIIKELKKEGDAQESSRGVMTECESGSASEHIIALEDAECCICLSAYDDEAELRELPCNHHFHCTCIDKWLLINATCPLCKFNILSTDNLQEV